MIDVYLVIVVWALPIALMIHVWPLLNQYHDHEHQTTSMSPLVYMKKVLITTAHDVACLTLLLTLLGGLAYLIIKGI